MKLSVIDAVKVAEYDVAWIELHTVVGNMVILDQHAPMIVELAANHPIVFALLSGEQQQIPVAQAVAHVMRNEVRILIP